MTKKPEQLSRKTIYTSPWVNLHIDCVKFPAGRIIEKHHVLDFERAAVVAIVSNRQNEILMIEAYRYVTDSIGWEVPAGGIDAGEDAATAAMREVLEETGYTCSNPVYMGNYHPSNGISNQQFHIVQCVAGNSFSNKVSQDFDKNEVRQVRWVSQNEVKTMIRNNDIVDGLSLTALLRYLFEI